jgi:hemerythrin-like metal-binding protein
MIFQERSGGGVGKVEWDPVWETGIEIIDSQHRYLLEQLNGLVAAQEPDRLEAEASRALVLLVEYVDFHFQMEEAYMEGTGYPGLAEHRQAHDRMREQAQSLSRSGHRFSLREALRIRDFLLNWLVGHFTTHDHAMARHLTRYAADNGWSALPGSRVGDR